MDLVYLYQISQTEHTRNGKLTPEIGCARERDLIAYLYASGKFNITHNIPNVKPYDIIINDRKISVKHSSNKKIRPAVSK